MGPEQICRHDFSMHQDELMWSRFQYLTALQGGVLTGTYYLLTPPNADRLAALALTALGIVLTIVIWQVIERDRKMEGEAFDKTGLSPIKPKLGGWSWLTGTWAIRLIVLLLVIVDIGLLLKEKVADYAAQIG